MSTAFQWFFCFAGFRLQRGLLEISNSLSEAELKKMKFLVKPKINWVRLAKIREGFELFEELETIGELSCTHVSELLKGIQRYDLLEKLGEPSTDSAEIGKIHRFLLLDCSSLFLNTSAIKSDCD